MPEIAQINHNANPSFVFERDNDDAHYFYWPYEITFPWPHQDIEPLKKKNSFFLSRYHYFGLTIWTDIPEQTPIAVFQDNFHTPIMVAELLSEVRTVSIDMPPSIDWLTKQSYFLFRRVFERKLRKNTIAPPTSGYVDKLAKELGSPIQQITDLFDEAYVRRHVLELIIIGKKESIDDLLTKIRVLDNNRLSGNAVCQFFDFR